MRLEMDFMIRGGMRTGFLVVMPKSSDLVVKEKKD